MQCAKQTGARCLVNMRPISRVQTKIKTEFRQARDVCAGISCAQKPIDIFPPSHFRIESADLVDQSAVADCASKLIGVKRWTDWRADKTLRFAEDKIDIFFFQTRERGMRMIFRPQIVGIEKADKFAASEFKAAIARRGRTTIFLAQINHGLAKIFDKRCRVVGRSVIDDDDFLWQRRSLNAGDCLGQKSRAIKNRNDHAQHFKSPPDIAESFPEFARSPPRDSK